jgi:hypothetical protein
MAVLAHRQKPELPADLRRWEADSLYLLAKVYWQISVIPVETIFVPNSHGHAVDLLIICDWQ